MAGVRIGGGIRRLTLIGGIVVMLVLGGAARATADDASVIDLGIEANAIVHDVSRGVVYAAVDQTDANYANKIVKLNPSSGAVIDSVHVGSNPNVLALADDDSYLYAGLDGASKVVRISLDSFAVDLEIPIPAALLGPAFAGDLAVIPGQPTAVAVARRYKGISPRGLGVAIFDGAVMRTDTTPSHIGENSIVFGAADTLYGSDLCCSGRRFYVVAVTASGANRTQDIAGLGGQRLELFHDGRVFQSAGRAIDVGGATPVIDGALATQTISGGALDYLAGNDRIYLAGNADSGMVIEVFDPDTYARKRTFKLPSGYGFPNDLVVVNHELFLVIADTGSSNYHLLLVKPSGRIDGTVTDRHTGEGLGGICVDAHPFGDRNTIVTGTVTGPGGAFSVNVPPGTYQVRYVDCERWDYAAEWYGITKIEPIEATTGSPANASFALTTGAMTGLVDLRTGLWFLSAPRTDIVQAFYYGNPGDIPMIGDWDCDGVDTPGLYRQSDGFVYLRNSNTQGIAHIRFFFGNPGDLPLAGDFNGDGCDTVSIYRPSQGRVFIINKLGANEGGLGAAETDYYFGKPGDKPFVGDFDFDGIDTIGLHRESTGLVYFRNSHTQGNAEVQYFFGDPDDRLVAGNFSGFWLETPAVFRPSDLTFYIRHTNTQGNADRTEFWEFAGPHWHPVAGVYGLSPTGLSAQSTEGRYEKTR